MGQPPKAGGLAANFTTADPFTQAIATLETPEDWARFFTTQGWGVFPVQGNTATEYKTSKQPPKGWPWTKRLAGEDNNGFTLIERNAAYGINLKQANLVVIDDDGNGELDKWRNNHNAEPFNTFTVKTAHGYHYYFDAGHTGYGNPSPFKKKADGTYYNIDVRGNGNDHNQGGYVIGAGSHIWGTNTTYTVVNSARPQPLPKALADFLTGSTRASQAAAPRDDLDTVLGAHGAYIRAGIRGALDELKALQAVPEGGEPRWDTATYRIAARLVELANHPDSPHSLAEVENMFMGDAPRCATFGEEQLRHKWGDAVKNVGTRAATIPQALSRPNTPKAVTADDPKAPATSRGKRFITSRPLSEYKPERVRFLWGGLIPLNRLTILSGRGGSGKSTFALWMAGQVTQGALPGELHGKPRPVLVLTGEDGEPGEWRPRFDVNGGDPALAYPIEVEETNPTTGEVYTVSLRLPRDLALLADHVRERTPALVIIDPITATHTGKNDDSQDVQYLLHQLNELAKQETCAVVGIMHSRKGGGRAEESLSGSHQWYDAARAVANMAKDRESGEHVVSFVKLNNGLGIHSHYSFRLEDTPMRDADGTLIIDEGAPVTAGKLVDWQETTRTYEQLTNRTPEGEEEAEERTDRVAWLKEQLSGQTASMEDNRLFAAYRKEFGKSRSSYQRDKRKAGLKTSNAPGYQGKRLVYTSDHTPPVLQHEGDGGDVSPQSRGSYGGVGSQSGHADDHDHTGDSTLTFPHDSNDSSHWSQSGHYTQNGHTVTTVMKPHDSNEKTVSIPQCGHPVTRAHTSNDNNDHTGTAQDDPSNTLTPLMLQCDATPCPVHGTVPDKMGVCAQCMAELS
ncbi:AAA family ATPase [Trueperella pyogenes]|uniref:AAA family ATPase n=1 Tax=Trueperella pyogenes TaxID=1661 RepID=UPI002166DE39|nr:AAA family ATPase [Trueperella pyogenes]UVJ53775.1 AAA family ATPase [Trueperella pyogenes]